MEENLYEHPKWYTDAYENYVDPFINLSSEKRGDLVAEASAVYMSTILSLTPELYEPIAKIGYDFHKLTLDDIKEKFGPIPTETTLLILLGAAVQAMGMLQMKLNNVRTD
jgi:hypothetical protein